MIAQSSNWRYIPTSVLFTERAFRELFIERECNEYMISRIDDEYCLSKTNKKVKFNFDDVSVYGKILELTSSRHFADHTNGVIIGEHCQFPVSRKEQGSYCRRASESIVRLTKAGYLVKFKTSQIMIPIVRGLEGTSYDQEGGTLISVSKKNEKTKSGFQAFVNKDMQRSLFRAQERNKAKSADKRVRELFG